MKGDPLPMDVRQRVVIVADQWMVTILRGNSHPGGKGPRPYKACGPKNRQHLHTGARQKLSINMASLAMRF